MAEDKISVELRGQSGAQSTGNPVLDSVVNIIRSQRGWSVETITKLHGVLLEISAKEPGGLCRPMGIQQSG